VSPSLVVAALAALTACGPSEAPVAAPAAPVALPGGADGACGSYRELPDVYQYCLAQAVRAVRTLPEMERLCAQSGTWEKDCRHAWVHDRMRADSGFDTTTLAAACGAGTDCAFELLDFRPASDVLEQVRLCTVYAAKYRDHCVGHAFQRWWQASPDAAEHARVGAAPMEHAVAEKAGYWLAANVACSGVGACEPASAEVARACQRTLPQFAGRTGCPAATRPGGPVNPPLPGPARPPVGAPSTPPPVPPRGAPR
jgi:hypothetical protein